MHYNAPLESNVVAYAPAEVRAEFIRRVYGLFFNSVLVTVGVGALCSLPSVAPAFIGALPILMIVGLVVGLAMAFASRRAGWNLLLLYLYSAIQGAILGPVLAMVSQVAPGVPTQAAVLTVAVFGGLSLYVLQTKKDFSYLGGMLFIAIIAFVVAGIVMFFVRSSLANTLYCLVGILIFGGYVLYDTSQILHKLGPDEAVSGAISLYLDLINLFWLILRLLMELNRRN